MIQIVPKMRSLKNKNNVHCLGNIIIMIDIQRHDSFTPCISSVLMHTNFISIKGARVFRQLQVWNIFLGNRNIFALKSIHYS